jgi:aminoglycoside 6'-N-acetyltransferase
MTMSEGEVVLRPAVLADVPLLERWDREPHVIAATSDDPGAETAFEDIDWVEEVSSDDPHSTYFVAEVDGRPIGAMQMIDPHLERTHYWGDIEPNLRALDIWIGEADCLGKGYGETMMRLAMKRCFADPKVKAIVIDPLASNTRAHKFYKRLGFAPIGRRMFDEDDCLVHELTRQDWEARLPGDLSSR